MSLAGILDVLLVLLLIGYLAYGYSVGFLRSLGPLVGAIIGAVGGYMLAPVIGAIVMTPLLRVLMMISANLLLIIIGHGAGAWVGRLLRRTMTTRSPKPATRPGTLDRIAGAGATVVTAAFITAVVAFGVGALGVPVISQVISTSATLSTIREFTPAPVRSALAMLRSFAVQEGVPIVLDALGRPSETVPPLDTGSLALRHAAQSVVRITGNAWQCGQSQSGSGFVIEPGRVVTNAHVVAGVSEPVIEAPGEPSRAGRVVYFDPERDLAVIDVPLLTAEPLELGGTLRRDSDAAFAGYPLGGALELRPAAVQDVVVTRARDIYGAPADPLEIYVLSGNIQAGNSGGPVLALDGSVVGVIFARGADLPGVGYAHTLTQLAPVANRADTLDDPVSTGECTGGD